eukprot:981267-Prorocentrum_minimum.AAC.2
MSRLEVFPLERRSHDRVFWRTNHGSLVVLVVCAPLAHTIGPCCRNMPPWLTRLVRAARICPLCSHDWSARVLQVQVVSGCLLETSDKVSACIQTAVTSLPRARNAWHVALERCCQQHLRGRACMPRPRVGGVYVPIRWARASVRPRGGIYP